MKITCMDTFVIVATTVRMLHVNTNRQVTAKRESTIELQTTWKTN